MSSVESEIPQWKKDLIARLRNQNKRNASAGVLERQQQQQQQLCKGTGPPQCTTLVGAVGCASPVQQPNNNTSTPGESVAADVPKQTRASASGCVFRSCYNKSVNDTRMVQERTWSWEPLETVGEPFKNGASDGIDGDYNNKYSDSDSSEDLHYGPGIVNRLKNKYLSLALRESNNRSRASILPMRKAASLENILDDDNIPNNGTTDNTNNRLFRSRINGNNESKNNVPVRYRNTSRGTTEMKRARSVEAISRNTTDSSTSNHDSAGLLTINDVKPKRESVHEDMLITRDITGNTKPKTDNTINHNFIENMKPPVYPQRLNRPKRIAPVLNEREKPPADFVKQTKLLFERRPESRTKPPHQTGEVAAKVASYKNIIGQSKVAKKPPVKQKPLILTEKPKTNGVKSKTKLTSEIFEQQQINNNKEEEQNSRPKTLPSPIPDISRIDYQSDNDRSLKNNSLSETPDLIMTSSPITPTSPINKFTTDNFLKSEIRHSFVTTKKSPDSPILSPVKPIKSPVNIIEDDNDDDEKINGIENDDTDSIKKISAQSMSNIDKASTTVIFNFLKTEKKSPPHLPAVVNKNISDVKTPPSQQLKLEINGVTATKEQPSPKPRSRITSPPLKPTTPPPPSPASQQQQQQPPQQQQQKPSLTILEIEKNKINTAKTLEQPQSKNSVINNDESITHQIQVPKVKKPPREPENNSIVFKFTDRKDVPDYLQDDGLIRVAKRERPKVGEGGIILLPGASLDESFTDEDDEIMRSLEAPPSPCDVTFINDNILIDGKSSLSQKTKKPKLTISFVEAGPEIYEYPSESSLLIDEMPTSPGNAQIAHTVPSITGTSSLANYTPKSSTEDFQPGVTRSIPPNNPTTKLDNDLEKNKDESTSIIEEAEQPILFSAGTNSDILF